MKDDEKKRKSVLEMNASEAKKFFLKSTSYVPIQLPKYFNFDRVLKNAVKKLGNKNLDDFSKHKRAIADFDDVNYELLINKDGRYDWRPLQIIHPMAYVDLVNIIVNDWDVIVNRFQEFGLNKKIQCISVPVESMSNKSDKAETVLNWWENLEQSSIRYSLKYKYCIKTDVTNCYGSIYTHSIAWAIMGKDVAKRQRQYRDSVGNRIDSKIQSLQYGQTNGIPQGGNLFDFIAEIVLGYSDLLLSEKLKDVNENYKIIRYRDDYRIFSNSKDVSEKIIRDLSDILSELNMHFNSKKTAITTNIIESAIKEDKIFWTEKRPIIFTGSKKSRHYYLSLQKHLLQIYILSKKYPNSGSVTVALGEFLNRLLDFKNDYFQTKKYENDNMQLISIVSSIIVSSPKSIPMGMAVLSKLLKRINSDLEIHETINNIKRKMQDVPNIGYIEIWLQRLSITVERNREYEESLCKKIYSEHNIWNSNWLKDPIDESSIVDDDVINKLKLEIPKKEVDLFSEYSFL